MAGVFIKSPHGAVFSSCKTNSIHSITQHFLVAVVVVAATDAASVARLADVNSRPLATNSRPKNPEYMLLSRQPLSQIN